MARSISVIKQQMIDTKNTYTELNGLNSVSNTSYWNLWFYIVAVAINLLEQIIDIFKNDIESNLINKAPAIKEWIRNNVFLFQYSSTTPQVISINPTTYKISYPTLDTSLQIIKQCAVSILANNIILIKTAKGTPPSSLSNLEKTSLQSYLSSIMPAGIYFDIISVDADKIRLDADIYFDGAYSSSINTDVINAINTYLYNMPFGGRVYVSELEHTILSVSGVKDVNIKKISTRKDSETFNSTSNNLIYQLLGTTGDVNNRYYDSYAGYLLGETTTNYTFTDTINFIAS